MISASFLTKHLLIDYRLGEQHYLKYLTDGDWAQNNAGWQWSAGCGCDAQPWFRIFNPITQALKFDPSGEYVRKYIPELSNVSNEWIHTPWLAPNDQRDQWNYPNPIIGLDEGRQRFLAAAKMHLKRDTP
jgi:deoxyribodipyrimidine photo-lyase